MKTTFAKNAGTGLVLWLVLLIQINPVNAQQKHSNKYSSANREKMEAQRVAYITQQLNLTPDEAKVFWPVYNEYDAKRHDLKKSFRESADYHGTDIEKLTEKEATQILDNQIIESQKFLDLRKEYHARFKSVLPAIKILKLYDAEREFQRILMDKMHSNPKSSWDKK